MKTKTKQVSVEIDEYKANDCKSGRWSAVPIAPLVSGSRGVVVRGAAAQKSLMNKTRIDLGFAV